MRRLALASTLATCLFLPTGAWALGLGEIELQSALNQRLDAEIPLRGVPADQADAIEVKLASEKAFQDVGLERPFSLTKLRFRVRRNDQGQYFVQITSSEPIAEPFLSFLVRVDWPNGNLLREYTVLLDPPVFASEEDQGDAGGTGQAADPGEADEAGVPGEIERSADPETEQAEGAQPSDSGQADTDAQATGKSERTGGDYGDEPVFLQVEREQEEAERRSQREAEARAERESDEATATTEQKTEQTDAAPDQQRTSGGSGGEYGPVQRGEALWSIAKRLKSGDVSVQQMMIALLRYNPEAFAGDNVNRLKEGYVLRVPEMAEVRDISAQKAVAQVSEQNAMWQEWRQARADGGAREAAPSEPTEASDTASTGGADDGELEIVGSQEGGATADEEASATASGDDSTKEQLQLAREQLESVQMEKEELTERVDELESTVEKMEKLITLREEKLSQLQQQLEALREQQPADETGDEATQTAETDTADATTSTDESDQTDDSDETDEQTSADDQAGETAGAGDADTSEEVDTATDDAGSSDDTTEVASTDGDSSAESAASGDTGGSGDGGGGDTAGDGGGETEAAEGETSDTTTAEADDDASGEAGDDAASDASQATEQAAPEQGVQTTRTQPQQEGWLDMLTGIGAAAGGVIAGLFAGGITSPGVLGAAAIVVVALIGVVIARRRRAQASAEEPAPGAILPEAQPDESFTETDPGVEAFTETTEATGSATVSDTASAEAAESALMEERLDLSDLEGGDESPAIAEDEEEASKDDTVAEADVYLAYGLHQQAEDVLRLALKESPQRADYQEKLLETLYGAGKPGEFVTEAKTYQGMIDTGSSRGWQRVVAMGLEIAPDDALFSSAADPGVSPDELKPSKPDTADFDLGDEAGGEPALDLSLDESASDSESSSDEQVSSETMMLDTGDFEAASEPPAGAQETPPAGESTVGEEELEFDLSAWQDAEPESPGEGPKADTESTSASSGGDDFDFDLSELELGGPEQAEDEVSSGGSEAPVSESSDADALDLSSPDEAVAGDTAAVSAPSEAESETDEELEFDLGDLDVGEEPASAGSATQGHGEASAPAAAPDETAASGASSDEEPAFDIDSLETLGEDTGDAADAAELDSQYRGVDEGSASTETSPATGGDGDEAPASEVSGEQEEFDTMLDLAKAYIDMGDAESASNALQEVIESGSPTQRREAETLLETVQ